MPPVRLAVLAIVALGSLVCCGSGVDAFDETTEPRADTKASLVTSIVSRGSAWRFFDRGMAPASGWTTVSFPDGDWKPGVTPIGYGNEKTIASYGTNPAKRFTTTYFRKTFDIGEDTQVTAATIELLRDDGAVVYLNGKEVLRSNMPGGAITYDTFASTVVAGAAERGWTSASVAPSAFVTGTNVLAVEVHQSNSTSTDLAFDCGHSATTTTRSPAPAPTPAPTASPAGPPETVHFIGRFDKRDAAGPKFDWSASSIKARFKGTAIAVDLQDQGTNEFEVVIDGASASSHFATSPGGRKRYTLAANLPLGEHEVLLFKRTEATFGIVQFLGFSVTDGAIVPAYYPVSRRIEIVGDSITTGYGNEGTAPCSFSSTTENAYLAYGALTARALNAELTTVAWQGRGVVLNVNDTTTGLMPQLYEQTLGKDSSLAWPFTAPAPDVVVVNLGTNDFAGWSAATEPSFPATFAAGFKAFVTKIRGRYPKAWIFPAFGPILAGPTALGAVQSVVSERKTEGDTRIALVQFPKQDLANDGAGCGNHPSLKTHAKMASVLAAAIRSRLGWP